MMNESHESLWVEKYRPGKIVDCILPKTLKKGISDVIKTGKVPNMLFHSGPGSGKTTAARAICSELGLDFIMINASLEGNIDTLRNKIQHFASTVSLEGGYKIVILDEADYLNAGSTQPALRAFMEQFSNNCRFILTCNFINRIIEPIHSRCSIYDFGIPNKEKPTLAQEFFKRLTEILDKEGVKYTPEVLVQLITKFFPDWRRTINECQKYGAGGEIDPGILVSMSDQNIKNLMTHLKDKDFKKTRKWVVENIDSEDHAIIRKIYDGLYDYISPEGIPQTVLILAQYQYQSAFVADKELNLVAMLTEIMAGVKFK